MPASHPSSPSLPQHQQYIMDVRSLLRNERAARRLTHPHATYSTTGKLICLVCQLQLKSESIWNSHLRSPQHLTRLQKYEEERAANSPDLQPTLAPDFGDGVTPEPDVEASSPSKKRKKEDDQDEEPRKRNKSQGSTAAAMHSPLSTELPSRPTSVPNSLSNSITPSPARDINATTVDEDEWAAFEKDIAAETLPVYEEAVISAPAMSAADIAKQIAEESYAQRKVRLEAEQEREKEDAARKLEDEFDEMKEYEERVRRLKERRDAIRASANRTAAPPQATLYGNGTNTDKNGIHSGDESESSEYDEDDEDEWNGFRSKF